MVDLVRLTDSGLYGEEDCEAPVWEAVEDAVERQFRLRPFAQINKIDHQCFLYLQSKRRRERFAILAQHQRFHSEVEMIGGGAESEELGPVELDVVRFIRLSYPHLGLLVGGMGGGKSTTLRYLLKHHTAGIHTVYCDLDPTIEISIESPAWAARVLSQYLTAPIGKLIPPADEFTKVWTWALSLEDTASHHPTYVLADTIAILRRELEAEWLAETPRAIAIRKKCHESIQKEPQQYLTYIALLVDYYLSVTCGNDRSRFLMVLDNVDPLPPRLQYELQRCVSRFQESAQCKALIAMRPMTYLKNMQAANRTMSVIEHLGPEALDLIDARIRTLVDGADLSKLKVRIVNEDNVEIDIGQAEIKYWINQVMNSVRHAGAAHAQELNAKSFIDGICNNSLRSALIVAPKLFTSAVVPFVLSEGSQTTRSSGPPRIRSSELVRAVLVGRKACFRADAGRVVDNIFDLGKHAAKQSLTCKIRLLKHLDIADNGLLTLEQLRDHMLCFGLSDDAILDGINSIIAQTKRLAWSDSVVRYESFAEAPASKLFIADAGRFYVKHAIFSLEYVQETHLDAPLPRGTLRPDYNGNKFSDRVTSLRLFLSHLHDIDKREVQKALAMQRGNEYNTVYGTQLISTMMTKALSRQVQNIGRAMLAARSGSRFHRDIEEALAPWLEIDRLMDHEDADVLRKIAAVAS